MSKIRLGDMVKCRVSGFTGMVCSKHEYINGCVQWGVQPQVKDDGLHPKSWSIDDAQLEVTGGGIADEIEEEQRPVMEAPKTTGGPSAPWE